MFGRLFGPAEQTQLLIETLVAAGTLNPGQGRALTSTLTAALGQLELGNDVVAINQLMAFINEVNALIDSGSSRRPKGRR